MKKISVFASSSALAPKTYHQVAYELGLALADAKYPVLYGAGRHGLMAALANGVIEKNGQITGVIPEALMEAVDLRLSKNNAQQHLIITTDIERRKDILINDCDIIIALPGGVGTFEELYEASHRGKIIILLGPNNYYESIANQHHGYIPFIYSSTVSELMTVLENISHHPSKHFEPTHLEHLKEMTEKIHAENQFICVSDKKNTFISVMTAQQYDEYHQKQNHPENTLSETELLFKLSHSIILFEYNVPLTYAILHKMMTYNQLGFHGKHQDNRLIHKRVILFNPSNPEFFLPTQQQLRRACEDNLLAEKHYQGLVAVSCIHEAVRTLHTHQLTVE